MGFPEIGEDNILMKSSLVQLDWGNFLLKTQKKPFKQL